jgi:hypothetical protein
MLAQRIKRVLPNVKIIMIIRNPVKRSISQYNMIADRSGTPGQLKKRGKLNGKSFETVVDEDLAAIRALVGGGGGGSKMSSSSSSSSSSAASPSRPSLLPFDVRFESEYLRHLPYGHGCHSFVGRGCYSTLIRLWASEFRARDELFVTTLEAMKGDTQKVLDEVFEFLQLDSYVLESTVASNTRSYKSADVATTGVVERLTAFYEPWNRDLNEVMVEMGFDPPNY